MDFSLTDNQQMFCDTVSRFAEMGLTGVTVAERGGSAGGTLADAILAIRAVAAE